jgi:hypothetical protein
MSTPVYVSFIVFGILLSLILCITLFSIRSRNRNASLSRPPKISQPSWNRRHPLLFVFLCLFIFGTIGTLCGVLNDYLEHLPDDTGHDYKMITGPDEVVLEKMKTPWSGDQCDVIDKPDVLEVTRYFIHDGKGGVTHYRLVKSESQGTWSQEYPKSSGTWKATRMANAYTVTYIGSETDEEGAKQMLLIRRKENAR